MGTVEAVKIFGTIYVIWALRGDREQFFFA